MQYNVEIRELLSRTISVNADSEEEACTMVRSMYKAGEVVLSADDFVHAEVCVGGQAE